MEKEPIIRFLEMTKSHDKIVDLYATIRIWLQKEGYTTESAARINEAPNEIWETHRELQNAIVKLSKDVDMYGLLKGNEKLFNEFIRNRLKKVDEKFPLVDEL
jgi:uncharacterized protein Yka (UPF0111/DUF47 family)